MDGPRARERVFPKCGAFFVFERSGLDVVNMRLPTTDQAEVFLNVACSGSIATPAVTKSSSVDRRGDEVSCKGCLPSHTGLVAQAFIICVVVPFAFFIALTPLFFESLPLEFWTAHFWGFHVFLSVLFTETFCRHAVGTHLSSLGFFAIWFTGITPQFFLLHRRSDWDFLFRLGSVLTGLYGPIVLRLCASLWRGHPSRHLIVLLALMTYGSIPVACSVSMYVLASALGSLRHPVTFWSFLIMWCFAPFLVKTAGCVLVTRGALCEKFTSQYCWMFYCEAAFGALGLALFARTVSFSVIYVGSLVPVLCVHLLRGTSSVAGMKISCSGLSVNVRIVRAGILLEALVCVLGRSIAYMFYFLMVGKDSLIRQDRATRRSLASGEEVRITPLNVYRDFQSDGTHVIVALLGFLFMWCMFCAFVTLLPHAWQSLDRVHPAACTKGSVTTSRKAWESPPEIRFDAKTISGSVVGSDYACWLQDGQTHGETLKTQCKVLVSFLSQQRAYVISTVLFILIFSISIVDLALRLVTFS